MLIKIEKVDIFQLHKTISLMLLKHKSLSFIDKKLMRKCHILVLLQTSVQAILVFFFFNFKDDIECQ